MPLPPSDHEELVAFLEPDQLVAETSHALPRAVLSKGASTALWVLRVAALMISAMVIYAFVEQLA